MGYDGENGATNGALRRTMSDSVSFLKGKTDGAPAMPQAATLGPIDVRMPAAIDSGPSIISAKVEMTGSIVTTDEMHVYGTINGNVRAAALTVCTGGTVKGDITAETIVVQGVVEGRLYGRNILLRAGAMVTGEIRHNSLGIDPAATFEGHVKRVENPMTEASSN